MECLRKFQSVSFEQHCILGLGIRLLLVTYSKFHDTFFTVPYTDVDYKVFTDAARYITKGASPFERHTYRYTPLLALLLTPNVLVCQEFGKILFSLVDILVAILIRNILRGSTEKVRLNSALFWLYNPLTIVVSTRGNADSVAVLLVMLTIDFLQRDRFVVAGLLHGLSVHFRLYPLVFSIPMYFCLSRKNRVLPNTDQLKLVCSCVGSLLALTLISYGFYGYQYLYESILYHVIRKDTRHNFSVYFYMLYLSANQAANVVEKLFTFLPQLVLLLALSYKYSSRHNLPFAMFAQAMVMVTYNPVLTSQYFFWFLSLLPLSLSRIGLTATRSFSLCLLWLGCQALWLLSAYALEFRGLNSLTYVWLSGLLFFAANVKILSDIIAHYK